MAKTAVVLFNLGGPDGPEAVRPFLFNLFNDPAIIGLPQPLRWLLAQLISRRRAPIAREIYQHLGGGSPLLPNTEAQATALEEALGADAGGDEAKVFIAMRYWHPMSDATAQAVRDFGPDRIVLLPLYPQFSTTTTGSSTKDWFRAARAAGLRAPTRVLCCYPQDPGFVAEAAALLTKALDQAAESGGRFRVLFSAHGLPKKIVAGGDPYQWQVEQSSAAVVAALGARAQGMDWLVCYQSRVGPLEWIGPATEDEIRRAGAEGLGVVLVPIAFVSEHSETLVELDIEYRELAEEAAVPLYLRVPTVGAGAPFVAGLAGLVRRSLDGKDGATAPAEGRPLCPAEFGRCACREAAEA
ncbi:MAG: ferrochelatase [Kiloniellales bacterium]|nr:ferrochelatase [Kiloniellales bacterium]